MFTHLDPPDLPDLDCITVEGSRRYVTPTGERYPSVTTVTGWSKRKFFAKWRRENPEESKQILEKGNKFHSIVEDYLNNKGEPDRTMRPRESVLSTATRTRSNQQHPSARDDPLESHDGSCGSG